MFGTKQNSCPKTDSIVTEKQITIFCNPINIYFTLRTYNFNFLCYLFVERTETEKYSNVFFSLDLILTSCLFAGIII